MAATLALVHSVAQTPAVRGVMGFLRQLPGFEACSEHAVTALAGLIEVRKVRRGQVVWPAGSPADEVAWVRSGVVWTHRPAAGDRTVSLGYLGRGVMLGLREHGLRKEQAEAHEDTTLLVVRRAALDRFLVEHPEALSLVVAGLAAENERLERRLALVCSQGARARLAGLLIELGERFGVRDSEGVIIDLRLTHREMAALIGATRETVSVAIVELRSAGLVRTEARRVALLQHEALSEIAAAS